MATDLEKWFSIDLVEKVFEGPFSIGDLKRNLVDQKIYWSDIAICPARSLAWVRLFEIPELTELCPPLPSEAMLKHYRNVSFKQSTKIRERLKAVTDDLPKLPAKAMVEKTRVRAVAKDLTDGKVKVKAPGAQVQAPTPAAPVPVPVKAIPTGPVEWHLLVDDIEGGPFSMQEIEDAFKQGKRTNRAYVWREGMSRWKPLERMKQFKHLHSGGYGADFADDEDDEDDFKIENRPNVRQTNRKKFVASVIRISSSGVAQMIGVTGDMSITGMKLHQDSLRVNYPLGTKHHLEIKPLKKSKVAAFKVAGIVRWVNPNTYEIGFEFVDMNPYDQVLLKKYFDTLNRKIG